MSDSAAPALSRLRAAAAPVLTVAIAVGYVGIDLAGSFGEPVLSPVPAAAHAGLVVLQALALPWRNRAPRAVLAVVVALDLVILATSGGQLGIGALAVAVASYAVWRRLPPRTAGPALAAAALATAVVGIVALALAGVPAVALIVAVGGRMLLLTVLPVATAEYVRNRAQLALARREQEALLDRQRREAAERALREERTALARELHDIAGHHLSGIIVTAQAAAALTATDPMRARELLGSVQTEARTALADLRRTVGLLREDGPADDGPQAPALAPSLARVPELVAHARIAGRRVELAIDDELPALSPLAEAAVYRTVQESLANVARHAPGAASAVRIASDGVAVRVRVRNDPPSAGAAIPLRGGGYGLAGMRERADLIGASLTTGPLPDGGWCNELRITLPHDGASA